MVKRKNVSFEVVDGMVFISELGDLKNLHSNFAEVQIAGENKNTDMGGKMVHSSEGRRLMYHSHWIDDDIISVVQRSELVEVTTTFTTYNDTSALRVITTVKNISQSSLVLEEVSAFTFTGISFNSSFTRFQQGHHKECQPVTRSLKEWGLDDFSPNGQKRVSFANVGSWSTKEELPQGIIAWAGGQLMFQIESSSSWYYEISDKCGEYYLYLGGPNLSCNGWACQLQPGESYQTPTVAIAFGDDLNDVLAQMTIYRRHIAGNYAADAGLPAIFNEYMHLSWDSPTAENTHKMAQIVAKTGAEYYVIDCGWHNEEPGAEIYPYVGQWIESKARFQEGVRKTTDYIRSLGMKPGLWIEPEIIGCQCEDMLAYYDDDCFMQRFGKRLTVMNRHFLDYRNRRVQEYMTDTIRRMVEDYGAEYIKFDYNQDCGVGTDLQAFTAGKGLEDCTQAFFDWVGKMRRMFPDVVFEGCSSGGLRMDHHSLSAFSLFSTSDQIHYEKYPYIAGNILSAVLPEQAAVWSYPVTEDCTGPDVSNDRIDVNMVNSFLGRMHLASHLERLSDCQIARIEEGVAYYNSLSEMKKRAVPYFPNGFTHFGAESVYAGLKDGSKVYLAAWNLGNAAEVKVNIADIQNARIGYPSDSDVNIAWDQVALCVKFPRACMAVFLEIEIKK